MGKNKINLKRKQSTHSKVLSDAELSEAIEAVTRLYLDQDFRTIAPALDNDFKLIFSNSKYEYKGFSSDLGILGDIRIHFIPKEGK